MLHDEVVVEAEPVDLHVNEIDMHEGHHGQQCREVVPQRPHILAEREIPEGSAPALVVKPGRTLARTRSRLTSGSARPAAHANPT
jgi:hypothetical protein